MFLLICFIGLSTSLLTCNAVSERQAINKTTRDHLHLPDVLADAILRRLRRNMAKRNVEPLSVPGMGPLERGQFVGLSTLRRTGEAVFLNQNHSIGIPTSMNEQQTSATFPCSVRVFGYNLCEGGAKLQFHKPSFYLEFKVRFTEDGGPQLDMCDLANIEDMTIRIGEKGPLSTVFSWTSSWFSTLLKSQMADNLQNILCSAVAANVN